MASNSLAIPNTNLRWQRHYSENVYRKTRKLSHSTCETTFGTYTLVMNKSFHIAYTLSYAPHGGEKVDLGQYRLRADIDRRVAQHIDTGI